MSRGPPPLHTQPHKHTHTAHPLTPLTLSSLSSHSPPLLLLLPSLRLYRPISIYLSPSLIFLCFIPHSHPAFRQNMKKYAQQSKMKNEIADSNLNKPSAPTLDSKHSWQNHSGLPVVFPKTVAAGGEPDRRFICSRAPINLWATAALCSSVHRDNWQLDL